MIGRFPCEFCKNFLNGDMLNPDTWKCRAYPNGIPETVITFMQPLARPKVCNNGIGFEPIEDETNE